VTSSVSPGGGDRRVARLARGRDSLQRLGQRADLVDLDGDRSSLLPSRSPAKALGVSHEQVVADGQALAEALCQRAPASLILLVLPSSIETIG
jgi:hypothetical protein